ncbi:MAG: HAD-superfamily subfamily hydrolase [Acidimicrobiaceae bacterium]|nr:HAD-superfamily subfamily hydrolase [Acidimicrobiaceae bacterium]
MQSGPVQSAGLREAAFFDLDKTVIAKAAMSAFRGPFYAEGLLSRRSIARAVFTHLVYLNLGANERRLTRIRESLLKLTKGWERDKVVAVVEATIEDAVEPIIYAEAMDLIEYHHELGRLVVIVSASPEEIVRPLGHHLGVDETIASRAEVDDEGRYTGSMAFYAYGPYKAEAMRELAERCGLDLEGSYAYTDSYTDLPMLEAVGHPVAVNPDRVLAKLARDRSWEVRHFVRPVRLRDRVRDRMRESSRPTPVQMGGVVLLAAGATALGWWLGSSGRAGTDWIAESIATLWE